MRRLLPALLLLLAACAQSPPPPPAEPVEFSGPSYTFNVASITVAQDYKTPHRSPYVAYLKNISPVKVLKDWVGTRLVAAGHENTMEVNIIEASVKRTDLPKQKIGIEGMFTIEQTERYDGRLAVDIKIYSPRSALAVAHLTAEANLMRTLPQDAAPIDRERLYHNMSVDLMHALEPVIDENIHRYLSQYLM